VRDSKENGLTFALMRYWASRPAGVLQGAWLTDLS
jgi:hypothetical protein